MKKREIEQLLDDLEISVGNLGYKYWIRTMELYLKNTSIKNGEIYKQIAKENNTTISAVEKALRHTYENKREKVKEFFKVDYKISMKNLLALMARELERRNVRK